VPIGVHVHWRGFFGSKHEVIKASSVLAEKIGMCVDVAMHDSDCSPNWTKHAELLKRMI
jgi:hypothetical protein